MASTRASNIVTMEEIVKASEKRLTELLLSMKTDLHSAIENVKIEITALKTEVKAIEHDVATHHDETDQLRAELAHIQASYSQLERQCIMKDIHDRRPNLLFYGIAELPKENTEEILREVFIDKMKFTKTKVDSIRMKVAHRLPKSEWQTKNKPDAPRPIIATFLGMNDREDIFEARKQLKGTGISVQTDIPGLMKKRRAILSRQANTIRDKENLWTRVRVVGTDVVLEAKEPHNKLAQWYKYT